MKRKSWIFYIFILLIIVVFIFELYNNNNEQEVSSLNEISTSFLSNDEINKQDLPLSNLEVHYIDVGQGDATLLKFLGENNKTYHILYDVGDWKGNEVVPYLEKEQVKSIDLIIVSHPHADHIGQLKAVLENFPVEEIWMTENKSESNVFQSALQAILDSKANYHVPKVNERYFINQLEIEILHPDSLTGDLNADSLAVRFTYGNNSFIFTGDAYQDGEQEMVKRVGDLEAEFLQLGHHGSSTSSAPSFVEAVNPNYAIYSAAKDNSYGHPHVETVKLFSDLDIPLYGTDVHGTIIVTTDGITSRIETEKEGQVAKRKPQTRKTCIDINEASFENLRQIQHINEERAKELIELRPFKNINELRKIYGIGKGRLRDIKQEGLACVN